MADSSHSYTLLEIKEMSFEIAIPLLDKMIEENPQDEEALTLRGQKLWKQNRRREAINDYLQAISINPASRAKILLDYANSILDYYNKDLLNP